jgi:O-antigen/teichoic acid export membrane protein
LGLIFVGATLFVSLVAIGYVAVLSGWQMFKIASLAAVVFGLLKLLAGMIGIKLSPTSNGVVFFLFLFAVAHLLISYGIVRIKFYSKGVAANSDWKQKYFYRVNIGKSVLPIALFSLAVAIMQNIDVLLVKNLTSAEVTGHYAVLNLLGRIIFWVNGAVIAVVLPAACANGMDNMRPAKKLVWSAYGLICCVGLCGTLIYFVAPNFIVSLLFGAKYLVFAKDLWLFGIIAFALSLLMLEANFSYARHDFRVSYVLTGVALLMIGSIHFYHETVRQVASGVFAAMILGFCAASVLNNCQIKKVVKREEVN